MRSLFLLGHTHHDVGYTNSPRIVDRMHREIVDRVLDLIDENPDDSDPLAFRWTFEVARPVIAFFERATDAQRARLVDTVERGRVSVTSGYLNMTQLPNEYETDHSYDLLRPLLEAGIAIRTEQHGDVNGIPWGTVESMRRAGVTRLLMALNPDHGRAPFTQPSGFWWEGRSGERIFSWLSTHYGFGEEWGIVDGDMDTALLEIEAYVKVLDGRPDYPFDVAIVHAGNDNRWPTDHFLRVAEAWNAAHPDTLMQVSTVDAALDALEQHPASRTLPVVRGEWADWWSHGHGSTAREVAAYRQARTWTSTAVTTHAVAAIRGENDAELATVLGFRRGPVRLRPDSVFHADVAECREQMLLFDEHTWGAWETFSKPSSTFNRSHWNAKAGFAYAAFDLGRDAAIESAYRLAASGDPREANVVEPGTSVLVVNASAERRSEPVDVEVKVGANGARMATVLVRDLPPFSATVLPIPDPARSVGSGRSIETQNLRLVVDPDRGITSLLDHRTGLELVDPGARSGLGQVVASVLSDDCDHPMITSDPKCFNPDNPGPSATHVVARGDGEPTLAEGSGWSSISWSSSAPGIPEIVSTARIYDDFDTIDFDVTMVKPATLTPESIFIAFPFAISHPEFLLDTMGAVFRADKDQLPDTSKDWYSIQSCVGVRGEGQSVVWTTPDAPLVQLGDIQTGKWARDLHATTGHIYSWLMNNYHFTNFQASQDGTGTYRYRLEPFGPNISEDEVARAAWRARQALFAREYFGPINVGSTGLAVHADSPVAADLRKVDDGVVLRLRNLGAQTKLSLTVPPTWTATPPRSLPSHAVVDIPISRASR